MKNLLIFLLIYDGKILNLILLHEFFSHLCLNTQHSYSSIQFTHFIFNFISLPLFYLQLKGIFSVFYLSVHLKSSFCIILFFLSDFVKLLRVCVCVYIYQIGIKEMKSNLIKNALFSLYNCVNYFIHLISRWKSFLYQ